MTRSPLATGLGMAVLLGSACLGSAADDTPPALAPADLLKSKGLKRSGDVYILAAEADVQKRASEARAQSKAVAQIIERKRHFDQQVQDGKAMLRELLENRVMLNRQLPEAGSVAEHNRIVNTLNEITDRTNMLQREIGDPEAGQNAGAKVAVQRESYIESILRFRQSVDAALEEYDAVAKSDEVKRAIAALNANTKRTVKLGPSKAFVANVKLLEYAERTVLTETIHLRMDGGIYWLDATFNGKTTKPMAFDTGAASVVLPFAMAKELGLTPGPDAPTVKAQVADGTITEAKTVIAKSIRVGKFTVKDVECTVMPASKGNSPPLLGQTFQKHFICKFSPQALTLVLSKVETETAAPSAAPKAKGTAKGKR